MRRLLDSCHPLGKPLVRSLEEIFEPGLVLVEGRLPLKSQMSAAQPGAIDQFQDATGFECFINHIHIEDHVPGRGCVLLEQAFGFIERVERLTVEHGISERVNYIVAGDLGEISVRFHLLRQGEEWLDSNLENYEEAVAVIVK